MTSEDWRVTRQVVLDHTFAEIDGHLECMCGLVTPDPAGHVASRVLAALELS